MRALASASAVAVEVRGVRKRFGRRAPWVLDGVDLAVPAGTMTVVVGGNGSGKSTLLQIAAGASRPSRGRVVVRPASVAYVPERLAGKLRMTAGQYVGHMGRLRGLDAGTVAARSAELFRRLALDPGPDVPVESLSKGNTQKVALVQALLAPVDLLVLDEPETGLDGPAGWELAGLLEESRTTGTAILASAHDPEVLDGADEIRLLVDGRLREAPAGAGAPRTARPARTMWLALLRPDDGTSPATLARTPGVLTADYDRAGRRLVVSTRDGDGLVRRALDGGWSLQHAEPAAEPPAPASAPSVPSVPADPADPGDPAVRAGRRADPDGARPPAVQPDGAGLSEPAE